MLPIELIDILCEYLDLEEVVSLSRTSTAWKQAIPEYIYQQKLQTRCPSFTPMNTSRSSWEECARVHIARLRNPEWMKNPYLYGIEKGTVSPAIRTHNTLVPSNFESFMEGQDFNLGVHSSMNFDPRIYFLDGNRIKIDDTEFHLGVEDTVEAGLSHGVEGASESGTTKSIPTKVLAASLGIEMASAPFFEASPRPTIVVKKGSAIACSSTTPWDGERRNFENEESEDEESDEEDSETEGWWGDGKWEARMAIKFNSAAETSPDIVYSAVDSNPLTRLYPFLTGGTQATAAYCSGSNDRMEMSFMKLEKDSIDLLPGSFELDYHAKADTVVWYDGLAVLIETVTGAHLHVYMYDLERQGCRDVVHGIYEYSFCLTSPDERYVVFGDFDLYVRSVWDLETNTQYYIERDDRQSVTLVGKCAGELMVATFDWDFLSKQLSPDCDPQFKRGMTQGVITDRVSTNAKSMFDRDYED